VASNHFQKLTAIYLRKFFQKKNLPRQEWKVINNGSIYSIDSDRVIRSILSATPSEQQMIADSLRELDDQDGDINIFLKQLAKQSHFTH
jgi:hypothetical protein